jgi:hypothetical protein
MVRVVLRPATGTAQSPVVVPQTARCHWPVADGSNGSVLSPPVPITPVIRMSQHGGGRSRRQASRSGSRRAAR